MRLYFAPFSLCTGRGALVLMAECSDLRTCRFITECGSFQLDLAGTRIQPAPDCVQ